MPFETLTEEIMELEEDLGIELPLEVIELVLRHLSVRLLKVCRLVCKAWNKEASRLLKGKLISRLRPKDISSFCLIKAKVAALNLPVLDEEIELEVALANESLEAKQALTLCPSSCFPVTNLVIMNYHRFLSAPRASDCAWLLEKCAPTLTHLEISSSKDIPFILECIRCQFQFPVLQLLEVSLGPSSRFFGYERSLVDTLEQRYLVLDRIQRIINNSPKLRTLKTPGGYEDTLPQIIGLRLDFMQIQHLEVIAESIILQEILHQPEVPALKSLALDCQKPETNVCGILQRFSQSLEHLEVTNIRFSPKDWGDAFPFFPVLQSLTVFRFQPGETWLWKTPALNHLRIRHDLDLCKILLLDQFYAFPSVEKITSEDITFPKHNCLRTESALALQRCFPSIRSVCSNYYCMFDGVGCCDNNNNSMRKRNREFYDA